MQLSFEQRKHLWETALQLPQARAGDAADAAVFDGRQPELIRVISDPKLRLRLLSVGMAETLQVPRGRQRIPAIIYLRPAFDARRPARASVRREPAGPAPTLEELRALLDRLAAYEAEVLDEISAEVDERLRRLRDAIRTAEGPALDRAMAAMAVAIDDRKRNVVRARAAAFERVRAQLEFGPGRYLHMISPEPREPRAAAAAPAPAPVDPRREAYRKAWEERLLPCLSDEWQWSAAIAQTLKEKPAIVLERLGDLVKVGAVERRVVRAAPAPPKGRRKQKHTRTLQAQFRLPASTARNERAAR